MNHFNRLKLDIHTDCSFLYINSNPVVQEGDPERRSLLPSSLLHIVCMSLFNPPPSYCLHYGPQTGETS